MPIRSQYPTAAFGRRRLETARNQSGDCCCDLSIVIPVFNGSASIAGVVEDLLREFRHIEFEIVLVNDGSADNSEQVCRQLHQAFPHQIAYLHLARNFGEHNAVIAGLRESTGRYVCILDDDGQHSAGAAMQLYLHALEHQHDVVYSKFFHRHHAPFRRLGSWVNDYCATWLLHKPRDLYLSSFKVISRFIVDQICEFDGPLPYIDGLVLRTTGKIGQIEVDHQDRVAGQSGYTLAKLLTLWLNMATGFSAAPLRAILIAGLICVGFAIAVAAAVVAAKAIDAQTLGDPGLRGPLAGDKASIVAKIPDVRAALLDYQRNFARNGVCGAVLDGRDIGTVVCPDAHIKIFVTASDEARARRRYIEHQGRGEAIPYETVLEDLRRRDARDSGRSIAPLEAAADALIAEMKVSQPALLKWLTTSMPKMHSKAYRWVAEMEEIAAFVGPWQTGDGFYQAAARLLPL